MTNPMVIIKSLEIQVLAALSISLCFSISRPIVRPGSASMLEQEVSMAAYEAPRYPPGRGARGGGGSR
jgi:hypothetical protein